MHFLPKRQLPWFFFRCQPTLCISKRKAIFSFKQNPIIPQRRSFIKAIKNHQRIMFLCVLKGLLASPEEEKRCTIWRLTSALSHTNPSVATGTFVKLAAQTNREVSFLGCGDAKKAHNKYKYSRWAICVKGILRRRSATSALKISFSLSWAA